MIFPGEHWRPSVDRERWYQINIPSFCRKRKSHARTSKLPPPTRTSARSAPHQAPTCKTPQNLRGNLSVWEALEFLQNWFQHHSSEQDDLFWQHELNIKAIHMAGHTSGDFTQGPQEGPFPQQFWTDRKPSVSQEILEIQALKWGSSMSMCHCTHGKSKQKVSSS